MSKTQKLINHYETTRGTRIDPALAAHVVRMDAAKRAWATRRMNDAFEAELDAIDRADPELAKKLLAEIRKIVPGFMPDFE